jgi:hypothetical protein
MVARTRIDGELVVMLFRDGEPTQSAYAPNGREARNVAFDLLGRRPFLLAGDMLRVLRADEAEG